MKTIPEYLRRYQDFETQMITEMCEQNIAYTDSVFNKTPDGTYTETLAKIARLGWNACAKIIGNRTVEPTLSNGAGSELTQYMINAKWVLFADRNQLHSLWERYHNKIGTEWRENQSGFGATVGMFGGFPVCISIGSFYLNGTKVLVVEDVSRVVDHDLIEEWLKKYGPTSILREGGYLRSTDAGNFHQICHDCVSTQSVV